MKKTEIAKTQDHELIAEYVRSYAALMTNYNLNRGTKQLYAHCNDLEQELLKRGLLIEEEIKRLH